ncbi:MAG: cytochrome ubiquinol oxidase subunit I [Anaerolineae bacterium UTCFX2]|jgi:cytochrome d ubiquinol oxidase subunit I|nr:cytochrome ubiquinol oxidase subunit I [Anaerolineae bacterium]OQY90950.1 MAG: cytochrome ubiquinol oxidase subunit I [Anaerolineae bacterium UTCFX2]
MDAVTLGRLQFGITTVYHFFFVPLTIGLSFLVALMETLYVQSGREVYLRMTKFWGKLFVINFAVGVVTGIVQEFQFGMNWSEYSRFVGDIFGAPLAIEALLAFFLESTFIGIWIFGWDKLSKGLHAAVMWVVAIGVNVSAFWILIANAFMQQPVGYVLRHGRAEMQDFLALILNPTSWVMVPHTVAAGFVTASFFVMGISAYYLLRRQHVDLFKRSFQIAAIVGVGAATLVALYGHSQAQHIVEVQPMKMAAAEALWRTEEPASFSLLTIGDLSQREEVFSIRLPRMLCLLAYNNLNCKVQGIYDLQEQYVNQFGPGDYFPPVAVIYWSFRIMVGIGFILLGLALWGVFLVMGDLFEKRHRGLRLFVWAIPLPYLANASGWIMTEMGRFPWVVYGLMKIEDGVSLVVPGGSVLFTTLLYTLVYGLLMAAAIFLWTKFIKAGPEPAPTGHEPEADFIPTLAGAQD